MKPKFSLTLSFLILFAFAANADRLTNKNFYYSKGFYSEVEDGLKNDKLKNELFRILTSGHIENSNDFDELVSECEKKTNCYQHSAVSYDRAREYLLGELDLIQKGNEYFLRDAYCQKIFSKEDFRKNQGPGPGKIPDHRVFSIEHTWPQSRFSDRFPNHFQKSDMHILFGVSQSANNSRGNIEFADVQIDQNAICKPVRRGWVRGNSGEVYFEPPDDHKGNVARALFYFSVRYKLSISEIEEESLRRWHRLDPVDQDEIQRHEGIFTVQKVRNPFIDHPELVELISDF